MKFPLLAIAALLGCALAPASRGASLVADYQFANTFNSSFGTAPALTPIDQGGTTGTFTTETVNGTPNVPVFTFDGNRGLLANTAGLFSANAYSVVFYARLDVVSGVAISKLLDFQNRTSDAGQYIVGGVPTFFDGLLPVVPGAGLFTQGVYAQFTLTRDTSNLVSTYLNGQFLYSFTDANGLTTLTQNVLTLFADDPNTLGVPAGLTVEPAAGAIARLRLYDGALTAAEVSGLDTLPVPEPGTVALLLAGVPVALFLRRRRAGRASA